jgi:uncharacterized membrane protein YgdD (TMEM256/DUF423 family)
MNRQWIVLGSLSACLAVAAGAFGAHALKGSFGPEALVTWETAARYQMYHALAMLAVGLAAQALRTTSLRVAGLLFLIGTLVFSGSLYALVLTGERWLGAITPIGGLALMAGWLAFAWAVIRGR